MDEVVYIGLGDGIGWVGMINEEHERFEGSSGQKAIFRSSNFCSGVTLSRFSTLQRV